MKEFTREKMMEESDPYFSPEEEKKLDDDGNKIVTERDKVKKNYFDSKYEYLRKKLEEEYSLLI